MEEEFYWDCTPLMEEVKLPELVFDTPIFY